MAKLRKMLGTADSPYIISLMRIIETQNKTTIITWSVKYAEAYLLPIYEKAYPEDTRLKNALTAALSFVEGGMKLADAKKLVREAQGAAKEAEGNPIAQAAARACAQAAATITTITNSLAVAFYGSAAIAYDRVGLESSAEVYEDIAAEVCSKYESELHKIAVENEPNPVKINWNC
ncbi:putative immunity protein [Clostridium culturomicium]|uniref:putative immunity protein n=1 Tax=Clostridium culturomicium TaxID=1499683 RepID=UPI0038579CC3